MPELRLNLVTREWVIIATERAKRPTDFRSPYLDRPSAPESSPACPFCPGNEKKTPEEHLRLADEKGWRIRVVANKYPALEGSGERTRRLDGLKRSISGVGVHEVIIEHQRHNLSTALFEDKHIEDLVLVYKNRFIEAHRDPRVEHVIIFKNHGEAAGTTVTHPHTQLIGTPVVPIQFRDRVQSAMHYFDDTGECLMCATLKRELSERTRVITDTQHFLTFIPYAALSPFHTWIFPKRHSSAFSTISSDEAKDLAHHLKAILLKFHKGLDNPDYNYVIRSSRPQDAGNEYCHWYISIVPRLTKAAGFELGSGMYINTSLPEESAEFLRSVK
jgi:UDPglucose--hexose-1-phosphate uridylyltransferase